ncbi:MAG: hypothetical protein Q4P20_12230 [Eubacteriales bacterium]|nr:hypothetical protein [Eubacteriales bacterium]
MNMNFDFGEWYYNEATIAERTLANRAFSFEPLFEDMKFSPGTPAGELTKIGIRDAGGENWTETYMDMPVSIQYASCQFVKFIVTEPENDSDACYNNQEQSICISPDLIDDDTVLLHEMIHFYESAVNELPLYFHDALLWSLYSDLKGKIPKLDAIITDNAHILIESTLYTDGGLHDILFLLKSFDLDIRNGYPLGSVFGYGREERFKEYTYQI